MKTILLISVCIFSGVIFAQDLPVKIACVGNSITEGGNNSSSYPQQLDTLLGKDYEVKNFGVGGRTLLKKGDFPYRNESAFSNAKEFEPHIVIILLGTNDSKPQNWVYKEDFFSDYMELIQEFRKTTHKPDIFVGFPPPVFSTLAGINDAIIHHEIIPIIDSVKNAARTFWINFYDPMTGLSTLFPDGVHPNAAGYTVMARIAADAILNRPSGVINSFKAVPNVIEEGQTSTLVWHTSTGSAVTLNGTPVLPVDSLVVAPRATTEYTLIAIGEYADTAKITVQFLPSGIIKSFRAIPPILEIGANDSSKLVWETSINSQVTLDGQAVMRNGSLMVSPAVTTTFTLIAAGAQSDTSLVTVNVLPEESINRSLLAQTFNASSTEYQYTIASAFDNDPDTYWLSNGTKTEWISIDLGREILIKRVKITWGDNFAVTYNIQVLDANNQTHLLFNTTTGDGGVDDLGNFATKGKSLRLLCVKPGSTTTGYAVKELEIYGTSKGVSCIDDHNLPLTCALEQNYPNPFNPETTFAYSLAQDGHVDLSVFNLQGQKVAELYSGKQLAGSHTVTWNAQGQATGIYFYRLSAPAVDLVRKCVLLK